MENKLWWPELARQPQKGMRTSGHIANVKACLPWETAKHFVRYALLTKLSRCNIVIGALGCLRQFDFVFDFEDEDPSASPSGLRHRLRVRQDWQLLCLCFYFRVPGYPTVSGIGYPVPKISVNARAYYSVIDLGLDKAGIFHPTIND